MSLGAGRDQGAVGVAQGVDVADPPGRSGDHGLLEQTQTRLPVARGQLRLAEQAQGEDLEVLRAADGFPGSAQPDSGADAGSGGPHPLGEGALRGELNLELAGERFARHLNTLVDVGLGYVRLGQPATTLSGGEAQRIKLATELQKITRRDTLYVLDEPTTGLHPADVEKLLKQLNRLTDAGNTVVVVEHDMDVISQSDWIIDMGPGAGIEGGLVVASGTPHEIMKTKTQTAKYLKRHYQKDTG